MLARRSLSLGLPVLEEPIVRREHLAEARQAQDVLALAEQQADQIRAQAHEDAQVHIEQAVGEFWAGANAFLQSLEEEREAFRDQALGAVEQLLNQALSRLLDAAELPERTRVLLRELAASQPVAAVATLTCHSALLDTVHTWLAESRFARLWDVQSNDTLPTHSLTLIHASGTFDVDWHTLRGGLLVPDA